MANPRLYYQPRLATEPEWVQAQIVTACKKLLKKHKDHWVLATIQNDPARPDQKEGYFIFVIEIGMPATLPHAAYSVTPRADVGRPRVTAILVKG